MIISEIRGVFVFLFVVGVHADDFHSVDVIQNLIYKTVLHIDTAGKCSPEIAYKRLIRRRALIRIPFESFQKPFDFRL